MSASDQHCSSDERFERLLIDSAQSDELPSNVDAAWQKFGVALNGVSALAAGAGGALAARRAARWLAAKWLIGGVLACCALTALSLHPKREQPVVPSAALSAASALPAVPSSAVSAEVELETQPGRAATAAAAKPKLRSIRTHTAPTPSEPALPPSEPAPPPSSTLAAQVRMLDAARSAIAAGAFAEALRRAERYRAEFPNGELLPEAEVVAIEALVERGERQPAALRAARFLARYPGDPHSAHVKWLVR